MLVGAPGAQLLPTEGGVTEEGVTDNLVTVNGFCVRWLIPVISEFRR